MPLTMPNTNVLNRQLGKVGLAAKSAGPSLFSPMQAAGPASIQNTSMGRDAYQTSVTKPPDLFDRQQTLPNQMSWSKPDMDALGMRPSNPYYNPPNLTGSGGSGSTGAFTGDLSVLNQYDAAFQRAAAEQGLDANWLKAMAAMEGGWGAGAVSGAGALGIMQVVPGGYGALEAMYPGWQTDPAQNIRLGAAILNAKIQENGGSLELGTQRYLGVGTDPWTGVSTGQYLSNIQGYYQQLQQNGGQFGGGIGNLGAIFANGTVPDWGEYGVESSNGYYGYGTQYGLNGTQHTGVDVPMSVGSSYRAPMSGVVTCGGTNNGSGADGSGCSAFGDYYGNGAGRVEVLLDDGTALIFGHSSTSAFQPGQRFNAGEVLGTSGGMNSPHIHLEARVRDSSTPSGWRIVDPRNTSGGSIWGGSSGSGGYGSGGSQSLSLNQKIQNFFGLRR